ncbi:hypothetical protein HN011_001441 [Eciton burchellii]|nr:hypothetical protein HN011_001441 [Eciton burchellii]
MQKHLATRRKVAEETPRALIMPVPTSMTPTRTFDSSSNGQHGLDVPRGRLRVSPRRVLVVGIKCVRESNFRNLSFDPSDIIVEIGTAMSLDESRRSQRPYRYGMVLLCVGALINWLGLAENYVEPVRYIGVACIVAGALLICAAMCCWLHSPPSRTNSQTSHANQPTTAQIDDPIHVISIDETSSTSSRQKPPDYETFEQWQHSVVLILGTNYPDEHQHRFAHVSTAAAVREVSRSRKWGATNPGIRNALENPRGLLIERERTIAPQTTSNAIARQYRNPSSQDTNT